MFSTEAVFVEALDLNYRLNHTAPNAIASSAGGEPQGGRTNTAEGGD